MTKLRGRTREALSEDLDGDGFVGGCSMPPTGQKRWAVEALLSLTMDDGYEPGRSPSMALPLRRIGMRMRRDMGLAAAYSILG
ncbi:hypothetical protein G3H63_03235 [Microbacterium resistens]|uniref:hypothetical protein n=1 Tax=Microbacterium resistens TaxID=156977 RepID=UPI001C582A05|nr:hypothetical protein [Microbacterium resistens]MBW1638097.1 hypothetical protein [Microbacterium resistens]